MIDENTRRIVRARAANRCEYCGMAQEHIPFPRFHIEHIRPIKHGGSDSVENLCQACGQCNLHKSSNLTGFDPQTDKLTALFHPRNDDWSEHFTNEGAVIVGLTPIGRTTVRVLNMNDPDRIELRAELLSQGIQIWGDESASNH